MRSITAFILSAAIGLSFTAAETARAEYTEISVNNVKDAIVDFNNKKESLINSDNFFYEAVDFYHHNIHDRAVFNITVNDPRTDIPQQTLKLNKEKFLQGFLKEGQRLQNYSQSYKLTNLESYGQDNIYMAKERITENAIVPPVSMMEKKTVTFSAATTCTSFYQIEGTQAVQLGSDCETTIAFPKEI